jgi:3-methyl-2-oxobutanoate hydroxymethyltransferase
VAAAITGRLRIPTIGIGSGAATDGQVLVLHDALGMRPGAHEPKFVKRFAEVGEAMEAGVHRYADEVRARTYPAAQHTFAIAPEELAAFETAVGVGAEQNILADW